MISRCIYLFLLQYQIGKVKGTLIAVGITGIGNPFNTSACFFHKIGSCQQIDKQTVAGCILYLRFQFVSCLEAFYFAFIGNSKINNATGSIGKSNHFFGKAFVE